MYSLVGIDGNAFSIMGFVIGVMRKERITMDWLDNDQFKKETDMYMAEATSGSYDNMLAVSARMIERINEKIGGQDD